MSRTSKLLWLLSVSWIAWGCTALAVQYHREHSVAYVVLPPTTQVDYQQCVTVRNEPLRSRPSIRGQRKVDIS